MSIKTEQTSARQENSSARWPHQKGAQQFDAQLIFGDEERDQRSDQCNNGIEISIPWYSVIDISAASLRFSLRMMRIL